MYTIKRFPANHDYCRFQSVFLVDQITDIGDKMGRFDIEIFKYCVLN